MRRRRSTAILLLLVIFGAAAWLLVSCRPSSPTTPTGVAQQIYVSQVSNTVLQLLSADKKNSQPSSGDLVDFQGGETFSAADTGDGYVQLGFPGHVDVYLASGTEMLLKSPPDEQTNADIVLNRGQLLVRLPNTFPADKRFAVEGPSGGQVWESSSLMGVQYDLASGQIYMDCLEGQCGYADSAGAHSLPAGSHVTLNGKNTVDVGPGNRAELWQFVPGLVTAPTPVPSETPNLAATQRCMYFKSLGLSCEGGFPTVTITPSPTANAAATQACARSQKLGTPCP